MLSMKQTRRDAIMALVKDSPLTATNISKFLGEPTSNNVASECAKMVKQGWLTRKVGGPRGGYVYSVKKPVHITLMRFFKWRETSAKKTCNKDSAPSS